MTTPRFRFVALTRWLSALFTDYISSGPVMQPALAPLPNTHPPGRAAGAVSSHGAVPDEFRV